MSDNSTRTGLCLTGIYRPKRRHLVISDWVDACVAEETLLDEEGKQTFSSFTEAFQVVDQQFAEFNP